MMLAGAEISPHTTTGAVHSMLANRVSYLMNWHGPSEPIDTACSSALVAVHRAAESIRNGDCDMAIAGGVNIMLNPSVFVSFDKAGMLSQDGRCKTFDVRADGYVRGEGVGAVLLKPLSTARADGDHIYAVLLGSAVNHGGHANSLTAPNPNAQAALLETAWQRAGIDPQTVSYIEAHGTGTSLGDPIEINGLKKAFSNLIGDGNGRKTCGLGAVKTNVGHLETASGMAGLFKVLLAMKHRKIPATLHYENLNPYIRLDDSPFYIVDRCLDWSPRDEQGTALPLRAGISAFGFGGANAHIVLESPPPSETAHEVIHPQMIILSAWDEDRLREQAGSLATHVRDHVAEADLMNLAYTLQVGRNAFPCRLALVVENREQLCTRLMSFSRGNTTANLFYGKVGKQSRHQSDETIVFDPVTGDLKQLAGMWILGAPVHWPSLHQGARYRISLPGYPFARERYWPDFAPPWQPGSEKKTAWDAQLCSRSTLKSGTPTYRITLQATAPWFDQHRVEDRPVLAGAVQLELVRATAEQALEHQIVLREVVWRKPVRLQPGEQEKVLFLTLRQEAEHVLFELHDQQQGNYTTGELHDAAISARDDQNLEELRNRTPDMLQGDRLYAGFDQVGIQYGPWFRTVTEVRRGRGEALSVLTLSDVHRERFGLHPALIDGALQTIISLCSEPDDPRPMLPFSVEEVALYRPIPSRVHVLARDLGSGFFDVMLLDERGVLFGASTSHLCTSDEGCSGGRLLRSPLACTARTPAP